MAKLMNFMMEDDGIRGELVAQMAEDNEDLAWIADLDADTQKKVMKLFMQMGNPEADHEAIMAELMAIPEFMDNMDFGDEPNHALKIPRIFKH